MKMIFLLFILSFLIVTCSYERMSNSQIKNDCSEKLCKISPETAAAIAKGYMCLDYELKEYKVEVLESTDTYEIRFRRVINQHLGIEGPTIFLRKSNGERLYTIHAK